MSNVQTNHSILIVDDDAEIRDLLVTHLLKRGLQAAAVSDGKSMRDYLASHHVDLIVLDLMMPGEDGISLCRELRGNSRMPIIMLTAMDEETDRIIGLEVGADDYVTKPFSVRELIARIRAVLRRVDERLPVHESSDNEAWSFNDWLLIQTRRELHNPEGDLVSLTGGEFDLLLALVRNSGKILSRDQLLELTRGREAAAFDRSVDVLLSRLRRKIEADPKHPKLIKTVRGGGYLFSVTATAVSAGGAAP